MERGERAYETRTSVRENATNLARQVVLRIGLGKELNVRIEPTVMNDGIGCIAGREEHREAWACLQHLLRQLPSIHPARHHDIGEQKIDMRAIIDNSQCASTVVVCWACSVAWR